MSRSLLTGFVLRSFVLWLIVRIALIPLFLLPPPPGMPRYEAGVLHVEPVTAAAISLLVTALVLVDVRAMRERVFLANLGASLYQAALVACVTAAALEIMVAFGVSLFE